MPPPARLVFKAHRLSPKNVGVGARACLGGGSKILQLRLIDYCITQLKAQGPSRTCNESKEEKKVEGGEGVSFQPWDLMVLDNKRACWWKTVTVSESGLG